MVRPIFLTAALAALVQSRSTVLESLPVKPREWTRLQDAPADHPLRLRIALAQPNAALFERTLYEISDPSHPNYGRHLSRRALADLMAPRAESTSAVRNWLRDAGIPDSQVHEDGEWINLRLTVREASTLLDANFGVWGHRGTTVKKVRALKYSVPEEIAEHITTVIPVVKFGQIRAQRSQILDVTEAPEDTSIKVAAEIPPQTLDVAACNVTITPQCLRALYKVGNYEANPSKPSLFGVAGFLEQWAKHDQLELFTQKYAPYAADANFSEVLINGGLNKQGMQPESDVEANLDIQYAIAMAYKSPVTYYSTGGRGELVPDLSQPNPDKNSNEPYVEFFDHLLKLEDSKLPHTLTTSYGEDEQSVPRAYAEKVCQMIAQLGARGVSVIFASGDTGPGSNCQTNDGKNTTRFNPIFPASCPFVTSVGGTSFVQPEHAVSFSSGGFSEIWKRPKYQDEAVTGYLLQLGDRWKGLYNPEGRGFPDVSAQGYNYHVFSRNRDLLIGGTSASAPTFASIISLLNNARLVQDLPPLGFLNPWLYSPVAKAGALTDIVHGGSTGCTGHDIYTNLTSAFVPYASWNATKGWDPVTGLGTPLFDKMMKLSAPGSELPHITRRKTRL